MRCAAQVHKKLVWMGRFGGSSPKPTHLYSNSKWITELTELTELSQLGGSKLAAGRSTVATTTRYTDGQGRRRCTGTKALKGTQPAPRMCANAEAPQ